MLIVIALLANVVALGNWRDGAARHRSLVGGVAMCGVVPAFGFAAIACWADDEVLELNLKAMRELVGETQTAVVGL